MHIKNNHRLSTEAPRSMLLLRDGKFLRSCSYSNYSKGKLILGTKINM